MATRLDMVLQKHPAHESGIRLLAERDPSGNLKYLDWGAKMLASGQALAPEIADILDLFHKFNGKRITRGGDRIHTDVHVYRPQDLAKLRDELLKLKRARDSKQRKREQLYRIEGAVETEIVYDAPDLIVRHIKNKNASVHYGHGTKWCIAMIREGYFEDYETADATFFFFERKTPLGDAHDKVALMLPRGERPWAVEAFTAHDERIAAMELAAVFGARIFEIFRSIYECSARHPPSIVSQIYVGRGTRAQLELAFAEASQTAMSAHEMRRVLRAISCNDEAPQALLEEIERRAIELVMAAQKRRQQHRLRPDYRERRVCKRDCQTLAAGLKAAMVIHPNVTADVRERLEKELRRRHVSIPSIHRTVNYDQHVEVVYTVRGEQFIGSRRQRRRRRTATATVAGLRRTADALDRRAAQMRKRADAAERKQTTAKKRLTAKRKPAKRKAHLTPPLSSS